MKNPEFFYPGMEASPEGLGWLWDQQFAALASDCPGFEAWDSTTNEANPHFHMHHYLLSGLGLPIGELFDLEALSEACQKANRWTFMFTSQPLNIPGGVGSPPNAIAIL
jgi:kynurenine formamidase